MSHPGYADRGHIFDRMSEECAELIVAISKARRFGLEKFHPNAPQLGNNREQILHEVGDVELMCRKLRSWFANGRDQSERVDG